METIRVAVACRNASGKAEMPVFTIVADADEIALGEHYDKAEKRAAESGYEEPFVCFDAAEYGAILSAARELDLVPQVVAIDITEGLVHSACCDAGELKVICYDESDTDESSEAVDDYPVGEDGALVHCWAHIEKPAVDPGLRKALP